MLTVETYASQITEVAQTKTTQQADTAGWATANVHHPFKRGQRMADFMVRLKSEV